MATVQTARGAWGRLALLSLALLCALAMPLLAAAQDVPAPPAGSQGWRDRGTAPDVAPPAGDWQRRDTTYFAIYYTADDAGAVDRYAAVADALYEYVAAVFDHGPTAPVPLRLYPDTESYAAVNPIARYVEGVLAHADARRGEISVAVDRVDRGGADVLRDTVRHELMHLVATELSADRLPIGFQEGLAQYAEKEGSDRRKAVQSLQTIERQGRLLSWDALNTYSRFLSRMAVAYPQSLSVVSFLMDRYGPGAFKRFVRELQPGEQSYRDALEKAYGRSAADLETEWREYLPTYFTGRWEVNLLQPLDLADAKARFAAGEYAQARPLFEEAHRLHGDLEQHTRQAEAVTYLSRIAVALDAGELATRGRAHLVERDYGQAHALLEAADRRYAEVGDTHWRPALATPLAEAARGLEAAGQLATAQALVGGWRYADGRAQAAEAAGLFLGLGDTAGYQRAQALQAEAEDSQRRLALTLVGTGTLLLVGLVVGPRRRTTAAAGSRHAADESIAL